MLEYELIVDPPSSDANAKTTYPFLYSLNLDQDVIRRLTLHLNGTYVGNDSILTTPLCKDRTPESILSMWDDIFNSNRHKMNEALLGLEALNRDKFGPRSIAIPWKDRISSVQSYFAKDECKVPSGFLFPSDSQSSPRLRPLSLNKAIEYLKNNTNSGLPFYTRKSKIKARLSSKFHELLERKDPCILFTRTQEQLKTRPVWGFPVADTVNETMYYRPLLSYQESLPWRAALKGPTHVDKQITELIDFCRMDKSYRIISIDFSAYDASCKARLQRAAFNYIRSKFQANYAKDIDYIEDRFLNIGIVTPSGVITGKHGVPSGSTFTNEVDSIIQYLVAKSSGYLIGLHFQIQGDDGVYIIKREHVDDFLECFKAAGLNVNREKSYIADEFCIYLQCLHHPDYRDEDGLIGGIYPTYRALNRLLFQERWSGFEDYEIEGKDYYSMRAISILENVKHHPLFEEFVHFIKSIDKYSLSVSRKGRKMYTQYVSDSSGNEGLLKNQYGDDLRGITSFKSWRLINK